MVTEQAPPPLQGGRNGVNGHAKPVTFEVYHADGIKPLPFNSDVELSVLGCIMLEGAFPPGLDLEPEHFTDPRHKLIFAACRELSRRGVKPQAHLVKAALGPELIERAGGPDYLRTVIEETPWSVSLRDFARVVRDDAAKRDILRIMQADYLSTSDAKTAQARIMADLQAIVPPGAVSTVYDAQDAVDALMEQGANPERNISTGISYLDAVLNGGLSPGELTVLAARPALGKTTLALNIAMTAVEAGKSVGILSLEMSARELTARIISAQVKIPSAHVLKTLSGQSEPNKQVMDALGDLSDRKDKLIIDQNAIMPPPAMRQRITQWNDSRGLDLLVVDHLQLTEGESGEQRVHALDRVTQVLRGLAKELDIAVLACSQLNREVEKATRKPQLSDLRDSGAIEQNADAVLFLHKPESKDAVEDAALPVRLDINIAKNRNGGLGTARASFWRHHSKIVAVEGGQEHAKW